MLRTADDLRQAALASEDLDVVPAKRSLSHRTSAQHRCGSVSGIPRRPGQPCVGWIPAHHAPPSVEVSRNEGYSFSVSCGAFALAATTSLPVRATLTSSAATTSHRESSTLSQVRAWGVCAIETDLRQGSSPALQ